MREPARRRFKKSIGRTITDLGTQLQARVKELEQKLKASQGPSRVYYVCQVCGPKGVHVNWNPVDGKCRNCGRSGVLLRSDRPDLPEFKCPMCHEGIGGQFDIEDHFDGERYTSGRPLERRIPCPHCDEVIIIKLQSSFSLIPTARIKEPKQPVPDVGLKPGFKSEPKKRKRGKKNES